MNNFLCSVSQFDIKIPIAVFLSLLGLNTYRLLTNTKDESPDILKSDPLCGVTGGGREECYWDCELGICSKYCSDIFFHKFPLSWTLS